MAGWDLLIKGGSVVDGTVRGEPHFKYNFTEGIDVFTKS